MSSVMIDQCQVMGLVISWLVASCACRSYATSMAAAYTTSYMYSHAPVKCHLLSCNVYIWLVRISIITTIDLTLVFYSAREPFAIKHHCVIPEYNTSVTLTLSIKKPREPGDHAWLSCTLTVWSCDWSDHKHGSRLVTYMLQWDSNYKLHACIAWTS